MPTQPREIAHCLVRSVRSTASRRTDNRPQREPASSRTPKPQKADLSAGLRWIQSKRLVELERADVALTLRARRSLEVVVGIERDESVEGDVVPPLIVSAVRCTRPREPGQTFVTS